jgi:drug/metabolite transporter (DMT)-like permease
LLALVIGTGENVSALTIAWSAIAAMIYSAGYLFFFKGFEKGNVSIVAATMNLWAVFTMAVAFLFMGQRLSMMQTWGVAMIIFGATLASLNWSDIKKQGFQLSSGVKETMLGAFFFGIYWNVSEVISEQIGWLSTTLFIKLGIVIFLLAFSFFVKQQINLSQTDSKTKSTVGIMGIIEVGAVALVNYGLTIGDAILITPIASALSIVTITLAIIFLKERVTRLQGFGIVGAIAGIILTAF